MTVDYTKIRLGAAATMVVDASTSNPLDIDPSTGVVTFAYNATYLPIEINRKLLQDYALKTRDELTCS